MISGKIQRVHTLVTWALTLLLAGAYGCNSGPSGQQDAGADAATLDDGADRTSDSAILPDRPADASLPIIDARIDGMGDAASGRKYYVATSGSDTNPGTADAPFRTIARAVAIVV